MYENFKTVKEGMKLKINITNNTLIKVVLKNGGQQKWKGIHFKIVSVVFTG